MRKRTLFAFLLVLGVALVACTAEPEVVEVTRVVTETETVVQEGETVEVEVTRVVTEEVEVVEEVTRVITEEVIVEATPVPVERNGAWVDTVVVVEEPSADSGVTRLLAEDFDVYGYNIAQPEPYAKILENPDALDFQNAYGSYNEFLFNPAECADGRLQPFSNQKIREAMNWMVDRDFLIQEYLGGLGVPRIAAINYASADQARFAPDLRALMLTYAYDPERGAAVVTEEMEAMGASLEDGLWTFNGAPVEISIVIRVEDERRELGDYLANVLEDIGFTVIRDYKTSAEASPLWLRSEPTECLWNAYTGGWIATAISRDASGNFDFFYTPRGLPFPTWAAYNPDPDLDALAEQLANGEFSTMEERADLFRQILPLSLVNSQRIWLYDRVGVGAYRKGIQVTGDLSAGVYGSFLWPYTLRYEGQVGGSVTWAMPSILTEPWNPVWGTNWIYDQTLIRATLDRGVLFDPNTGVAIPHRIESAAIVAQEGFPIATNGDPDWLTLEFAPEIVVPDDVWAGWDATEQRFLTAGEVYTETQTAILHRTVTYPADLYDTVKWHDGSPVSVGDFLLSIIMMYDQSDEASAIYDEGAASSWSSTLATLKGIKISSTDPLVIETYTDNWTNDAENNITLVAAQWMNYGQNTGAPWHLVAPGILAEEKGLAAFSAGKATANEVEWLSYLAGPTLDILNEQIAEALETAYIPYAPTMGEYVTADEATARYTNYQDFFARRGHLWLGTGPFYVQRAFPVEGTIILERNPDYPDPADKFARFTAAPVAEVTVDGPGQVTVGEEAVFDVFVEFQGEPYAMADIASVAYLLVDANGGIALQGDAEAVEDGLWQVTLSADATSGLETGSNSLEVVAVSNLVALPGTGAFPFVTAP